MSSTFEKAQALNVLPAFENLILAPVVLEKQKTQL